MAEHFQLKAPVQARPLEEWPPVSALLLGTQSRIVQGERWYHHVIEAGEGPPLFLYHGIGGHAETFARCLPILARHFHVYAVDALFHGYSSKEGFDHARMYDLMADGVVDLARALGHDRIYYEGESMGSMIGVNLGFRYPELVEKMVLNTGFYLFKMSRDDFLPSKHVFDGDLQGLSAAAVLDPTFANVQKRLQWLVARPEHMTEEMVHIRQTLYRDPEINASMRRVFNLGGPPGRPDWDYTEQDLAGFRPETLVIWGEYNPNRGPDFGEHCADLMGARFYEVKDAGHWPQWEQTEEYSQLLIEFLQG